MKRVLVTGATGFIGSHLAKKLNETGYDVVIIAKPSMSRNLAELNKFIGGVETLTCDISDYFSIRNTLKVVDPDVVAHLAALSPVRDSFEKPFSYVQANIVGTMNIAHAMMELPDFQSRKLVYASTAEVYGMQKTQPIKEDAPLNPSSPYSNTKAMTDMYLRMMSSVYKLNTTVMRCTNTYGRKMDRSFVIEYLMTEMLKGNPIYIGAPNSIRDYMYVDDHVNAYIKAIEHHKISGEAFNASTGNPITNKEVALKIADIVGYKKKIVMGKYPPDYPVRPIESDQPFISLNSEKIKRQLGWQPGVKLDDGLKMCVEYWKNKLKA